jgi:phosphoglycolate phosphatase
MNKNGLIIFDVDGTLVNSASGTIKALKETIKEIYLLDISDEALIEVYHHHFKHIIGHFCTIHDELKLEKAKQLYVTKSLLYSSERNLFPGVFDTLSELSKSFYIATATNLTTDHLKKMFDYFEISHLVDHIRGTDFGDEPKPNPSILLESISMFKMDKSLCFMVGDSLNDIRAGKNAGIKTIAMCYKGNDAHYFDKVNPDYTAMKFSDVEKIVT